MIAEDYQKCTDIARTRPRRRPPTDLCVVVVYDGSDRHEELASRLATSSTLPIMLDSTEPQCCGRFGHLIWPLRDQLGELRGRRRPGIAHARPWRWSPSTARGGGRALSHRRRGPGPHPRKKKVEIARAADHRQRGVDESSIDTLSVHRARHRSEESRDGIETIEIIPRTEKRRGCADRGLSQHLVWSQSRARCFQLGVPARILEAGAGFGDRARVESCR